METKCISYVITICIFISFSNPVSSQTMLAPGDIAFIGINADDPDAFSFITLTTISAGTVIYFTDNGWKSDNTFRNTEGIITWTSPATDILPGTIIFIELNNGWKTSKGTVSGSSGFSLSASGDQILAYQEVSGITFLTAIQFNDTSWETDATSSNTSKLPNGLTNSQNAVALGNKDNAIYSGRMEILDNDPVKKFNSSHNWYKNDTYRLAISPVDFPYIVWQGNTDNGWNTATNWISGLVPDNGLHVYIPTGKNPLITSVTQANCKKITIEPLATLTLKSDANGTGTLITDDSNGSGTFNIERYIPSINWHLIASPVTTESTFNLASRSGNNIRTGVGDFDLAPYSEVTDNWTPYTTFDNSVIMLPGTGYSVRRNSAGSITFVGNRLNTDTIPVQIKCSAETNGWNCIGNPYTTAIDATLFLDNENKANLDENYQFVYLWDQSLAGGTGDYFPVSSGNIAPCQGFFVNAKRGGGIISFTPEMRIPSDANFKSGETHWPSVQLIAESSQLSNETTIVFNNRMTSGLDPGFDAGKLKGNSEIALFSRLLVDNGIDFAIQALPELSDEVSRIPIGIDLPSGGEISFRVLTTRLPNDIKISIEDIESGITTSLGSNDSRYSAILPPDTYGIGRFYLQLQKTTTQNINNHPDPQNMKIYSLNNMLYIEGFVPINTHLQLFSADGKQWLDRLASNTKINTIDISAMPVGIYLLRIYDSSWISTQKIFITNNR